MASTKSDEHLLRGDLSQYALIPLAVSTPEVDMALLKSFVQRHCEQCAFSDNAIRYVMFHARKPIIDDEMLTHSCDPRFDGVTDSVEFEWDPIFAENFPQLVRWCDTLPFRRMFGLELVTQTDDIREHLDVFGANNSETYYERFKSIEPMYYRLILSYPNDVTSRTRSFFVTRTYQGKKHYAHLPKGTCTFAMSSSICYHGATFNQGNYKTTGVIYGELDPAEHYALLERSLKEYSDFAIQFPDAGPVAGPGANFPYNPD